MTMNSNDGSLKWLELMSWKMKVINFQPIIEQFFPMNLYLLGKWCDFWRNFRFLTVFFRYIIDWQTSFEFFFKLFSPERASKIRYQLILNPVHSPMKRNVWHFPSTDMRSRFPYGKQSIFIFAAFELAKRPLFVQHKTGFFARNQNFSAKNDSSPLP